MASGLFFFSSLNIFGRWQHQRSTCMKEKLHQRHSDLFLLMIMFHQWTFSLQRCNNSFHQQMAVCLSLGLIWAHTSPPLLHPPALSLLLTKNPISGQSVGISLWILQLPGIRNLRDSLSHTHTPPCTQRNTVTCTRGHHYTATTELTNTHSYLHQQQAVGHGVHDPAETRPPQLQRRWKQEDEKETN